MRFKVIARASIDGRVYEGFAVNELKARHTPNSLSGFQMSRKMQAEATIVDFGGRADALFVLLVDYLDRILRAYNIAPSVGSADDMTIRKMKEASGTKRYEDTDFGGSRDLPRIAAFRNEADPTSVYEVDPDNLARTHGPGARFDGLFIEIVDPQTPLTNQIQQRLRWLDLDSNRSLLQPRAYVTNYSAELGRRITPGAFKSR